MTAGGVRFMLAEYSDPTHARDLVMLLDDYARDPMGGGEPLSEHVRSHLAATLAATPNAFSILGYVVNEPADELADKPAGERPSDSRIPDARPPERLSPDSWPPGGPSPERRPPVGRPVALANCFTSLSTFACRPLVNVHDLAVAATHRGQGVGRALLDAVEREARARGACKITLEVLEGNAVARRAYERVGFRPYVLDQGLGTALFLEKKL